jgi:hypothetical protein
MVEALKSTRKASPTGALGRATAAGSLLALLGGGGAALANPVTDAELIQALHQPVSPVVRDVAGLPEGSYQVAKWDAATDSAFHENMSKICNLATQIRDADDRVAQLTADLMSRQAQPEMETTGRELTRQLNLYKQAFALMDDLIVGGLARVQDSSNRRVYAASVVQILTSSPICSPGKDPFGHLPKTRREFSTIR